MTSKLKLLLNKRGLTLIELIITLVIISMMILVITQVYVSGMVNSRTDMKKAVLQTGGRTALEGITRNIKLASAVEATHDAFSSDATNLILKIPAIDDSEDFIYSGGARVNDYIVYYLEGKNLHKIISSTNATSRLYTQDGTNSVLMTNVKSLSFTYEPAIPSAEMVSINVTLEDTSQKEPIEISLNAGGRMRNVQ